jgi:CheY-like chemotaxis protein
MPIRVLWVEDEPDSIRYEMLIAEQHGWHITWAGTVSGAQGLVRDTAFDLVVIDLILPMTDYEKSRGLVDPHAGIHFIESVREPTRSGRTRPDVPMLVLTAVDEHELQLRVLGMLESERYYLVKPLREETYREVVAELTQRLGPSGERPSQSGPRSDN